jgi:hypothetical protein
MARKQIVDITAELRSWLPNYDSGPDEYPTLLLRLLASLQGGERLEEIGYERFNVGWHEINQIVRVLEAVQDRQDIEELVDGILDDDE